MSRIALILICVLFQIETSFAITCAEFLREKIEISPLKNEFVYVPGMSIRKYIHGEKSGNVYRASPESSAQFSNRLSLSSNSNTLPLKLWTEVVRDLPYISGEVNTFVATIKGVNLITEKILSSVGIKFEREVPFKDDFYRYKGESFSGVESFKISTTGSHWLNQLAASYAKKGWPVDLFYDPALEKVLGFTAVVQAETRSGRIGFFVNSSLLFKSAEDVEKLKSVKEVVRNAIMEPVRTAFQTRFSMYEAHESIHLKYELARRGVISDKSLQDPVHVAIAPKTWDLYRHSDDSAYQYLSAEENTAYTASVIGGEGNGRTHYGPAVYLRFLGYNSARSFIQVLESLDRLSKKDIAYEKRANQTWAKIPFSQDSDVVLYLKKGIDENTPWDQLKKYISDSLEKSIKLSLFNLYMVHYGNISALEFSQAQRAYIDHLNGVNERKPVIQKPPALKVPGYTILASGITTRLAIPMDLSDGGPLGLAFVNGALYVNGLKYNLDYESRWQLAIDFSESYIRSIFNEVRKSPNTWNKFNLDYFAKQPLPLGMPEVGFHDAAYGNQPGFDQQFKKLNGDETKKLSDLYLGDEKKQFGLPYRFSAYELPGGLKILSMGIIPSHISGRSLVGSSDIKEGIIAQYIVVFKANP